MIRILVFLDIYFSPFIAYIYTSNTTSSLQLRGANFSADGLVEFSTFLSEFGTQKAVDENVGRRIDG